MDCDGFDGRTSSSRVSQQIPRIAYAYSAMPQGLANAAPEGDLLPQLSDFPEGLESSYLVRLQLLLIFGCACAAPPPPVLAPPPAPPISVRLDLLLGRSTGRAPLPEESVTTDLVWVPASCRAHGGERPHPNAESLLTLGRNLDRRLDRLGLGQLWIRLYAVRTGQAIDGGFWLEPRGRNGGIERVDSTWVRLEEHPGSYNLRIRSIGSSEWQDTIRIRRGRADSLTIGLGNPWLCRL